MIAASDWVEVVQAIPAILWAALAVLAVLLFRGPIAQLLPTLQSIALPGGVKAQFGAALSTASQQRGTSVAPDARSRLERRIARHADLIRGASAIWVDDDHTLTRPEREGLAALGMTVETATCNAQAEQELDRSGFDLVISDMARPSDPTAGAKLAELVREKHPDLPVILYVGHVDPERGVPPAVFGIADRPDELFHLIIDALERGRG